MMFEFQDSEGLPRMNTASGSGIPDCMRGGRSLPGVAPASDIRLAPDSGLCGQEFRRDFDNMLYKSTTAAEGSPACSTGIGASGHGTLW